MSLTIAAEKLGLDPIPYNLFCKVFWKRNFRQIEYQKIHPDYVKLNPIY